MDRKYKALILAAGKGTRLASENSDLPKVMRQACNKPLLWYVLDALSFIEKKDIIIVVGYLKDKVTEVFKEFTYAEQTEQLGTGHAVMAAGSLLSDYDGEILVCCGDMPVIKQETYQALINAHFETENDCTILSGICDTAHTYGRIIRDENGEFVKIIEHKDCDDEQIKINEVNSGIYLFRVSLLYKALESLGNENAQKEYYLTDVPEIMRKSGGAVGVLKRDLGDEMVGVNTPEQLKQVEEIIEKRNMSTEL